MEIYTSQVRSSTAFTISERLAHNYSWCNFCWKYSSRKVQHNVFADATTPNTDAEENLFCSVRQHGQDNTNPQWIQFGPSIGHGPNFLPPGSSTAGVWDHSPSWPCVCTIVCTMRSTQGVNTIIIMSAILEKEAKLTNHIMDSLKYIKAYIYIAHFSNHSKYRRTTQHC